MRRLWLLVPVLLLAAAAVVHAQRATPLRVVVYQAPGVAPRALETALEAFVAAGFDARAVTPEDVRAGALDDADVALFTGGRGSLQGRLLQEAGRERVRAFVRRGGGYVGICAGSYLAIQGPAEFNKIGFVAAHNLTGDRWHRGIRPTRVVPNDGSEPLDLHYANGPLLTPERVDGLAPYVTLATFDADVYWEAYDTHPGEMPGTPAVAAARYGEGRILLFSPNPTLDPGHPELLVRGAQWTARGGAVPASLQWRDVFGP
ncbi:MAG: hypothetical protein H6719_14020 [Sandaracinaceae bacterium]|nr:hypothetical protein [Sandaracinaceae bacterium]